MKILYLNCSGFASHTGSLALTYSQVRDILRRGHEFVHVYYMDELQHFWAGDRSTTLKRLSESGFLLHVEACDAVVVNGEGTLHHRRGRDLLCALALAQEIGKPTYLVNTVIQDVVGFDDVLHSLDDFTVRDQMSFDYLKGRGIASRIVLDSIIDADFDPKPDIDLSGMVVCSDWHQARDNDVGRMIWDFSKSHKRTFFYPLLHAHELFRWQHVVANWEQAELILTGRQHGVYLAGLAGVPFVAFPSNTHKVEGLVKLCGLPIPICYAPSDLDERIAFAKGNPSVFKEFQSFLNSHRPLTTFQGLGYDETRRVSESQAKEGVDGFFRELRKRQLQVPWIVNAYRSRFFRRRKIGTKLLSWARRVIKMAKVRISDGT